MPQRVEFRKLFGDENAAMLDRSKILAVFVEVDDAYGLMIQDRQFLSREERSALIRAARELPTRD